MRGGRTHLLEDEIDGPGEAQLRVDGQLDDLLHQRLELLRGQLVEDTAHLLQNLLLNKTMDQVNFVSCVCFQFLGFA